MRLNNSSVGQTILYKQECDILGSDFPWRSDHCIFNNILILIVLNDKIVCELSVLFNVLNILIDICLSVFFIK